MTEQASAEDETAIVGAYSLSVLVAAMGVCVIITMNVCRGVFLLAISGELPLAPIVPIVVGLLVLHGV